MKQKRSNSHNNQNFIIGLTLFECISELRGAKSFKNYIELLDSYSHIMPNLHKIIFNLMRVSAITHIIEHNLILKMELLYKKAIKDIQEEIKKDIIKKTTKMNSLNKEEALKLIKKQQEGENVWMIPPILQYVAGYSLGELIHLYGMLVDKNDDLLLPLLDKFKNARNNIVHNMTSSRIDISQNIDDAINSMKKIFQHFDGFKQKNYF